MKKKTVCLILSAMLMIGMLSACSGQEAQLASSSNAIVAELTPLEQSIAQYKELSVAEPSVENFATLASYYQEAGMIKKQRNILELSYRSFAQPETLAALQPIVVNAEEENVQILENLQLLEQNMATKEYRIEALAQLLDPSWHSTMMPVLQTGIRSYYWHNPDTQNAVFVQVGYDSEAQQVSRVWHTSAESSETNYLYTGGNEAVLLSTTLQNGGYNGPVSADIYEADTGTVYHEEGTFTNGLLTGDYTAETGSLGEASELYALLLAHEELELASFTGNFNENAHTTVEQPEGENTFIAYAYDENGEQFIQRNIPESSSEEAALDGEETDENLATSEQNSAINDEPAVQDAKNYTSDVFNSLFYHMPAFPVYTAYEPVVEAAPSGEVTLDLSTVQVRVHDFEIEWFDGNVWHNLGPVQDYIMQDPFYTEPTVQATQQSAQAETATAGDEMEETQNEEESAGLSMVFHLRQLSEVVAVQSTQNTQNTQAQTTTPTPTPAPATPTPAPEPAPAEPAPAPAPDTGNDGGDIAWTPDLL